MPSSPFPPPTPPTRPQMTLRVFSHQEQQELHRLAAERGCSVTALLAAHLGPLRKQLQQRLQGSGARRQASASGS